MSPSEIALQLLPMIGVRTLDPNWDGNDANQPGLVPGDIEMVALAQTQAIQEIFGLGPSNLSEQRFSVVLRAPKTVSFTVTQFSTVISGFAGWEDWMRHCTVQGGDADDNELLSATELVRPYTAGDATISAVVYSDAIVLPTWLKNTIDPVECGMNLHLRAAQNRDDFRGWSSEYQGSNGPHRTSRSTTMYLTTRTKSSGEPSVYLVEPRYEPGTGPLELVMRFNPMPANVTAVTFKARRKPPIITAGDINSGIATVSGTLLPNVTGRHIPTGKAPDGTTLYVRSATDAAGTSYLWFETGAGAWFLGNFAESGGWVGPATSGNPAGNYAPSAPFTGVATVTLSAVTDLIIPTDWHETILVPFAKKYFMAHPSFSNKPLADTIVSQYATAKVLLESFKPQIAPTEAIYY